MKLATVRSNDPCNRNGDLILVSKDNKFACRPLIPKAESLLRALENWADVSSKLAQRSQQLNAKQVSDAFPLILKDCIAPLPVAPGFYDGSAFLSHVYRARKARGDELPASAKVTPLMYQGVSDNLLAWNAPLPILEESFGGDFEGEFAVVTTDVPRGVSPEKAASHIALLMLFNDITLREVLKTEIEFKFGFVQSKPNSSFAPFLVTPDELGTNWAKGRINLELVAHYNGELFGSPNGREMHFGFPELVAHAARTRPLSAGSIVGSGTVSNEDATKGFCCLTEKRFLEVIEYKKPQTRWLRPGDRVQLDVTMDGSSVFGPIDQTVSLN